MSKRPTAAGSSSTEPLAKRLATGREHCVFSLLLSRALGQALRCEDLWGVRDVVVLSRASRTVSSLPWPRGFSIPRPVDRDQVIPGVKTNCPEVIARRLAAAIRQPREKTQPEMPARRLVTKTADKDASWQVKPPPPRLLAHRIRGKRSPRVLPRRREETPLRLERKEKAYRATIATAAIAPGSAASRKTLIESGVVAAIVAGVSQFDSRYDYGAALALASLAHVAWDPDPPLEAMIRDGVAPALVSLIKHGPGDAKFESVIALRNWALECCDGIGMHEAGAAGALRTLGRTSADYRMVVLGALTELAGPLGVAYRCANVFEEPEVVASLELMKHSDASIRRVGIRAIGASIEWTSSMVVALNGIPNLIMLLESGSLDQEEFDELLISLEWIAKKASHSPSTFRQMLPFLIRFLHKPERTLRDERYIALQTVRELRVHGANDRLLRDYGASDELLRELNSDL